MLDEPTPFGPHLGCEQDVSTMTRSEAYARVQNMFHLVNEGQVAPAPRDPDKDMKMSRWHMKGFHGQCLERYKIPRAKKGANTNQEYACPRTDDDQIRTEEFEDEGILGNSSSSREQSSAASARSEVRVRVRVRAG